MTDTTQTPQISQILAQPAPNPLLVFGVYWNERGWVEASLRQIDALNPQEIILCDGCFDPRQPNYSTDGTREILAKYVAERPHARLISALRVPKWQALGYLLRGHTKAPWYTYATPGHWKVLLHWYRCVPYRLNQALTFQHMISLSTHWQPGHWFMTLDADQFYPDAMIAAFHQHMQNPTPQNPNAAADVGLLTGQEYTFFQDFSHYTPTYEQRTYNNMPHRIYPGTTVIPTRGLVINDFSRQSFRVRGALRNELYENKVPQQHCGVYHHYKFQPLDANRLQQGYQLGDRKPPEYSRMVATHTFSEPLPSALQVAAL